MRFANIVKAAALPAIALWLAGCASTGGQSTSDVETTPEVVTEEVVIETTPVLDPAVQAVIDSGDVQASPEQVEQLLADKTYHFGFDSSKLKESDYKALDVQAAYLNSLKVVARTSSSRVIRMSAEPALTTWPWASVVPML